MRNGQGDQMQILFNGTDICINGFAHESKLNGWRLASSDKKKSFINKLFSSKIDVTTEQIQEININIINELPEVFHEFIF